MCAWSCTVSVADDHTRDPPPQAGSVDTPPQAGSVDTPPQAVIFDKDGTLVDFEQTWSLPSVRAIRAAAHSPAAAEQAADALGLDLETGLFADDSLFLVGPNDACDDVTRHLLDLVRYRQVLDAESSRAVAPMAGAEELLDLLDATGIPRAVMTNDSEAAAIRQLTALGWRDRFHAVLGSDSGHGAKPDPTPLLAAAAALGVPASGCVMGGDTGHDIDAGRAAGMRTILIDPDRRYPGLAADLVVDGLNGIVAWLSS